MSCAASAAADVPGSPGIEIRPVRIVTPLDLERWPPRSRSHRQPYASATRRVSVVNSIAFRKPISFGPFCTSSARSSSQVQRRIGLQRHQFARKPRLVGIGEDGLAALLLLDLAGAVQQRVEIAEYLRAAGPPSSARCRECRERCRPNRRSSPAGRSSFPAARPISRSRPGSPICLSFMLSYM